MTYEEGMAAAQVLLEERHGAAIRASQKADLERVEATKANIRKYGVDGSR